MKLKDGFLILLCICTTSMVVLNACSKDDDDDNGGEPEPQAVACFTSSLDDVTFEFNSSCSENAETYQWDFGDGTISQEENPEHAYSEAGTYTVVLTVTGAGGNTDTSSEEIEVSEDEVEVCIDCICTIGGVNYTTTHCGSDGEVGLLCLSCDQNPDCYCEE